MPISLEIVTPLGVVRSLDTEYVYVPGAQGELGILPGHEPLITIISPGELRCKPAGTEQEEFLVVGNGFLQVVNDRITVVTDLALEDAQIDEHSVEKAIAAAKEALKERETMSREEQARYEANLAKQLAVLSFKKRKNR